MKPICHVALAITGASGAVYGLRLAEELLAAGIRVSLVISSAGFLVLREECGLEWTGTAAELTEKIRDYFGGKGAASSAPTVYAEDDFLAPMASGSNAPDAMVICPCSMGTLGRVAAGLSATLIERSADVALKEGRPL